MEEWATFPTFSFVLLCGSFLPFSQQCSHHVSQTMNLWWQLLKASVSDLTELSNVKQFGLLQFVWAHGLLLYSTSCNFSSTLSTPFMFSDVDGIYVLIEFLIWFANSLLGVKCTNSTVFDGSSLFSFSSYNINSLTFYYSVSICWTLY